MILGNIYLKTFNAFGRNVFTVSQFAELHRLSTQSSKVLLHRLKKNFQLFKVEWGRYILLSPKHWVVLEGLKQKPKLHLLAITIYEMFPTLSMLLLYGSQVRGDADRYSDYDVLVVNDKPVENVLAVRELLEKKLEIRLHLTIYSERGFQIFVITEPYLRFWFKEGVLFDEKGLILQLAKPIAKMGYLENLQEARTYLRLLATEHDAAKRARYAFTALRIALLIEHAIKLDYDYNNVNKMLLEEFGDSITKIRARRSIKPKKLDELEHLSKGTFRRVSDELNMLGDNESDILWKKSIGGKVGSQE